MQSVAGWTIVGACALVIAATAFPLRRKLSPTMGLVVAAAAGAGIAVGGLLQLDDVGAASWFVAPAVLAVAFPAQVRALFAPGGPFRT